MEKFVTGGDETDDLWVGVLGPIYDRVIEKADVYVAGTGDLVASDVGVTLRESAGSPGWVGVVDADLTAYREFKLELRLPGETAACGVLFVTSGAVLDRTLIRGTGRMPGDTPKVRSRPRVLPKPREL